MTSSIIMALSTNKDGVAAGALAGSVITIILLAILVFFILLVIAEWRMFTKAGEKGWKSLIPIYNIYVMCKLTWAPKFFWIRLIVGLCAAICGGIGQACVNSAPIATIILCVIAIAGYITVGVLEIISLYRISTAYGHGAGYTIGLILIPNIMLLVLGWGSSKYEGNVYLKNQNK